MSKLPWACVTSKALPTWRSHNCEGASTGILQSLLILPSGNRGSKYIGDVLLLGFTVNADIIGDVPHSAPTDPEMFFF